MSSTNSTMNNNTSTGIKTFCCPVDHCGQHVNENPRKIAEHIRKNHNSISKSMGLQTNPGKLVFICKPCDSYTTTVHHHCFECEHPENGGKPKYFKTAEERDAHLKSDHNKWWYEYECKFGLECRGKKGGCGFNHNHFDQPFLTDTEEIPAYICRYDKPWEGTRCYRDKCSYSHFWGRVRYLIKIRSEATGTASKDQTCASCAKSVSSADA